MKLARFLQYIIKGRHKIGLALSAGGAKGFAHIGVLKVLVEEGIPIYCIAGSSAGALIGGAFASGATIHELQQAATSLNILDFARLFFPTFERGGLIDTERVMKYIQPLLRKKDIRELTPKFACVATNLNTGEEFVFKKGSLLPAIRASIAMPGIFTPCQHTEGALIDGGASNPLPIDVAFSLGATFVIAVNVIKKTPDNHAASSQKAETPPVLGVILSSIAIMQSKYIHLKNQTLGPHIIIEPYLPGIEFYSFHKSKEIIKAGEVAAQKSLTKIKLLTR